MTSEDLDHSSKWKVFFSEKAVIDEFRSIPVDLQASLTHLIEMVEELGLTVMGMPFVKHIENDLWELRAKAKSGIARGIYVTRTGRNIYILRVIHKKTARLARTDIDIARQRARRINNDH